MSQILTFLLAVVAFAAIYALLRERQARASGVFTPVHWGRLMAGVGLAAVALIAGLVFG